MVLVVEQPLVGQLAIQIGLICGPVVRAVLEVIVLLLLEFLIQLLEHVVAVVVVALEQIMLLVLAVEQ
jgi:hypothetical protein